ncbi:MAG: glycosyltransferase [Polyangiaceae bacterium]|nr:glycosyltransferase [Polyangiaceae bacterium]MCL4755775.1 glycosyltransferase [Myxococcales bacterium]
MLVPVPGFSELPWRSRARALGLAALQLGASHLPVSFAIALLPGAAHRRLRRLAAPLRVPLARPRASIEVGRALAALADARVPVALAPEVSIVVPTAGAVRWLELCLRAVAAFTRPGSYEVVVIDDATPDAGAVAAIVAAHPGARLARSDQRRGFAASVNAGVALCRAGSIVVLNDDVVVTPGWLDALLARLRADPRVAWVGPVSNDTGDEASVGADYSTLEELLAFASRASGPPREVEKLALYCALLDRAAFETVGGLDQGYRRGMFEDDDLAMALGARGKRVLLAPEVFVHHAAGTTLRALSPFEYFATFELNRRRFEQRWQVRWRVREGQA